MPKSVGNCIENNTKRASEKVGGMASPLTTPPGFASLGGCGPTVPALRGPLTRGYSKGALPGECAWELKSSRVVGSSITLEAGGKWRPCRVPGLASWGSQSAQWHCTPCWGVACTGVVAGWLRCMEFNSCNLEWARCDLVTSVDPLGGG